MKRKIYGVTVGTPMSPQSIKDKLKPVTSVNGAKPDRNGNVEVPGSKGNDGGYYTPVVSQVDDNTVKFSFAASTEEMAAVEDKEITLPAGKDGADGVSPRVEIGRNGKMVTVYIEDKYSGKTFTINDGADGVPGVDGKDGKDGTDGVGIASVQENMTVNPTTGVHSKTVTVNMTDGQSFTLSVQDGENGKDGNGTAIFLWDRSASLDVGGGRYTTKGISVPSGQTLKNGDLLLSGDGDIYLVKNPMGGSFEPVLQYSIKGATGEKGEDGATGPAGTDGKSAYAYAQDGGYTGTEEEFAEKLASDGNSSAAQPDWDASEEEEGHILNRPFYTYHDVVIPETYVNTSYNLTEHYDLIVGKEYIVIWDGTAYNCVAKTTGSTGTHLVITNDSYEPLLEILNDASLSEDTIVYFYNGVTEATIAVYDADEKVKTIPKKYLPDNIGSCGLPDPTPETAGKAVVVNASGDGFTLGDAPSSGGGAQSDWNADEGEPGHILNRPCYDGIFVDRVVAKRGLKLAEYDGISGFMMPDVVTVFTGEEYTVNYNGMDVNCTCVEITFMGLPMQAMGNLAAMNGVGNTGEPFVLLVVPAEYAGMIGFGIGIVPLDGSTTLNVSVRGLTPSVKPIPTKYLPRYTIVLNEDETIMTGVTPHAVYSSQNRDEFAELLYNGGDVWIDISAPLSLELGAPVASVCKVVSWFYSDGLGLGLYFNYMDGLATAVFSNGTWTPHGYTPQ